MAKPHQLKEVERVRGEQLSVSIPALVNEGGQLYAALVLGVSQATVSTWLKQNGFRKVTKWEREADVR